MTFSVARIDPFKDRNPMGTFVVTATAADTGYVDLAPLFRLGTINIGILIQPFGAAVTPSFTLLNATDCKKIIDSGQNPATLIPWDAQSSVADKKIQSFFLGATYMRLVFAAAGSCTIGAL